MADPPKRATSGIPRLSRLPVRTSFAEPPKVSDSVNSQQINTPLSVRRSRPSLLDRTMETLSQIPPSPSPRRRQSGFFSADSPAVRPSRPATSVGHYPPLPSSRPVSPSKRPVPPRHKQNEASAPDRRLANTPRSGLEPGVGIQGTPSRTSRLNSRQPLASNTDISKPLFENKTCTARSSQTRASLANLLPEVKMDQKAQAKSASKRAERKVIPESSSNTDARPNQKSSAALRETIANARRKVRPKYDADQVVKSTNAFVNLSDSEDPSHVNVLKKRIMSARSDGKLNISAMGLKAFPGEVIKMYELSSFEDSGIAWYESVDLVRLNAADNDFEDLGEHFLAEDSEDSNVFAGLQTLDLHGNRLQTLPPGLRQLEQLTVLNLSRNQIKNDSLATVSENYTLRELYLAENTLTGSLHLLGPNLEILDLHSNAITVLSESLSQCTNLRELNLSSNKLTSLPTLNLPHLTTLNLSSNQIPLDLLMASLTTPLLSTLTVSACRISSLPPLRQKFPSLTTLLASDNSISVLDIASVTGIEVLDLRGNDLRSLPPELGLEKGLKKLLVGGNPMRAPRKEVLEGSTEGLMKWLRGRCPAEMVEAQVEEDEEIF